jgi:hypothetical protein
LERRSASCTLYFPPAERDVTLGTDHSKYEIPESTSPQLGKCGLKKFNALSGEILIPKFDRLTAQLAAGVSPGDVQDHR